MSVEARRLGGNAALVIGMLGLVALLAMGVFGQIVAPLDPNAGVGLIFRTLPNGNTTFDVPPTMPDPQHPLGTDSLGRDQWSRVLAGARLTLTIVLTSAILRLAIGIGLGLVAGWSAGVVGSAIRLGAAGVAAIPQLLLAIMLVLVTRPVGIAGFVLSLALVGWPEIVEYLGGEVRRAKARPFIEAARALGAPSRDLVGRHVITALAPQLLAVAALETGAVLLLLAELGIVGLFVAGATFIIGDYGPVGTLKDRAPEWGQMLGSIQFFAITNQLSTLIPAIFIVLASAVFTLLADGLRAASDPFGAHGLLPRTFGVLAKSLAGVLCLSAVGFATANVNASVLTMEEGREIAARSAASVWPGSEFVAGVARFAASAHGMARPERLVYYFRNDRGESLRIAFPNGDRLAIEVKPYEMGDEIDLSTLNPLPAGLLSYDVPIARSDQTYASFRDTNRGYLVRAIVTWPKDRDGPVYEVTYGLTSGQLALRRACCFDARTGDVVDSLVVARMPPPWPVPPDCAATPAVVQQLDRIPGYFVTAGAVSVGALTNLWFQGDNLIQVIAPSGVPTLEAASDTAYPDARADIVNPGGGGPIPGGATIAFANLRLAEPGCWSVRIVMGERGIAFTLYAYPWECRPARDQAFPPPAGVTPRACTPP